MGQPVKAGGTLLAVPRERGSGESWSLILGSSWKIERPAQAGGFIGSRAGRNSLRRKLEGESEGAAGGLNFR